MNTDSLPKVGPGLREKLEKVTGVRALMVTLLLLSAVTLNVRDLQSFFDPTYLAISGLILATYLASLVYSLLIRISLELRRLALVQFVGDSILSGGLIILTGGPDSAFLFLFFLSIITAAYLMGHSGALFSASACSVVYALMILISGGHLPLLRSLSLVLVTGGEAVTYVAAVNVVAFYAVALLAGHLAERLGQVDTELEQRWTDIRQLRALNQNIVSSIASGLCTLDLSNRIIWFNAAAERITGLSANRVLGRRIEDVFPQFHDEVLPSVEAPPKTDVPDRTVLLERPDGKRVYLDLNLTVLHDASGQVDGHILAFIDVTEVRRLQEAVERQKRMAAIGQLSASIAHEIRNPLASISGSVQVLRESLSASDEEKKLMAIVVREIDRLNDLIEDFLAYARPQELARAPLEVGPVVEESVLQFKQDTRLSRSVDFVIKQPDERLWIDGDVYALRQVLLNLFRNAAEAMNGAGTIQVTITRSTAARNHYELVIEISDSGPGLSSEAKKRLFEPFFTTKQQGTGLGLATAHRLIETLGGMIWAEDGPNNQGTTFHIGFMLADAPVKAAMPSAESNEKSSAEGRAPIATRASTGRPEPVKT